MIALYIREMLALLYRAFGCPRRRISHSRLALEHVYGSGLYIIIGESTYDDAFPRADEGLSTAFGHVAE